jgi:hypothetical protein
MEFPADAKGRTDGPRTAGLCVVEGLFAGDQNGKLGLVAPARLAPGRADNGKGSLPRAQSLLIFPAGKREKASSRRLPGYLPFEVAARWTGRATKVGDPVALQEDAESLSPVV